MADQKPDALQFIEKWSRSGGAELANSQLFLIELCKLLDVPVPEPTQPDEALNRYTFEKAVLFNNGDGTYSPGRIDLYRQNCFVLESKQGIERKDIEQAQQLATATREKRYRSGTATRGTTPWAVAMQRARQQAKDYAEALSEWPPFLIVADIGYCFDIYADFSQSGKNYSPFPDPKSYRVYLGDLNNERHRQTLRAIWTDPHSLNPSRRSAKVTRDIAERLGILAKSLEADYSPDVVAGFLMRCLFTMFSEDIGLLPQNGFSELLLSLRTDVKSFVPMVESLWDSMDRGKFSPILRQRLLHFNGGFFEDHTALPLTHDQLAMLIEAASADWTEVEPAIFGTLLMRALDPRERRKLGAHFTPREYVERLVMPTIIEPLRNEWNSVYAAAVQLESEGKRAEGLKLLREFHGHLCEIKILDPACGTANFLYVALELVKRLEGEVLLAMQQFGETQLPGFGVDPQQFLGIEVDARAAAIAELVLWIGFLQWHFRTRQNVQPPEPVLKSYHNIECRDAVLEWDSVESVVGSDGKPVTRWDGQTTKLHPVTGEDVPDESARVQELRYLNPRKADWPEADYIVGNPPFIGTSRMRESLGDGYTKTIREVYTELPESCDFVMYWWHNAAANTRAQRVKRFGFISTNSIRQTFNRRILALHLDAQDPLSISFAVPDHPWVDSDLGAAVRIAMTVGVAGRQAGIVQRVTREDYKDEIAADIEFSASYGFIQQDLRVGAEVSTATRLKSNEGLSSPGVKLHGAGFIVTPGEAESLGLGKIAGLEKHMRIYRNGKDITQKSRNVMVIDLYGLSESQVQAAYPEVYQWLYNRVKSERESKVGGTKDSIEYAKKWWIFGKPRNTFRPALASVKRYIATTETAKHRFFVFLDEAVLPDNMLIAIAIDDPAVFGILSSSIHVCWALASGGTLEDRPRYNKSVCFETYPFPVADNATNKRIADLAERLDAHRKRQQELHPTLTMTGMYNVLEKLRSGEPLNAKEKTIHEQGLVSVLKQIHDDLDAAVFDAYGWPHDLSDEEILQRLVDLNHERADEEKRGVIRWLRPEFQNPQGQRQEQIDLPGAEDEEATPKAIRGKANAIPKAEKRDWPKTLPERVGKVREVLVGIGGPATVEAVAAHFTRAPKAAVGELLETLVAVGQARQVDERRFAI
jgi:hypothetical protein